MLPSFIVYTALALVLALLGWHVSHREQRRLTAGGTELPFYSWEIVLSLLIFAVVAGLRWQTGYDQVMYLANYDAMKSLGTYSREAFEPGFSFITRLFARAGASPFFYFSFWALLQIGLVYYAVRHHKTLLPWLALVLMLGVGSFFNHWMNTMRQSVVECAFVAISGLIMRRRLWIFLLITLLLSTLHRLAFLMVPLYFLPQIKIYYRTRYAACLIYIVCFVFSFNPGWIMWLFDRSLLLLDFLGYDKYYNLFLNNPKYAFHPMHFGLTSAITVLVFLLLIWHYPNVKKNFKNDKFVKVCFIFAFCYMCYTTLLSNTTIYLLRPAEIATGFLLVFMSMYFLYLYRARKFLLLAISSILVYSHLYIQLAKTIFSPGSTSYYILYHTLVLN